MKQDQKQRGFAIIETLLIIVVLAILGFTGWFVYHSKQTADKALNAANSSESAHANVVKSFEECKKSPGSTMLLIYPEQCITKDKKTFTDNSQKYLVIKEWSVKIELNDPVLTDAIYTGPKLVDAPGTSFAPGVEAVLLATKNTLSMDYTCGGNEGDGGEPVTHSQSSDQDYLLRAKTIAELSNASNHVPADFVQIGGYYYIYEHNTGHGNCSVTDAKLAEKARNVGNAYAKAPLLAN